MFKFYFDSENVLNSSLDPTNHDLKLNKSKRVFDFGPVRYLILILVIFRHSSVSTSDEIQ